MNQILDELDITINRLEESEIIKRLEELKNDIIIQKNLDDFTVLKDEYNNQKLSSKEFSMIKKELYSHPLMDEYFKLYSELNKSLIQFNIKIALLLDNKDCHRI